MADKYRDVLDTGLKLTRADVERDARLFFQDNFKEFLAR